MIENSSAGLVMVGAEVSVTVTGEEHHQAALARYPVAHGGQRLVAVELGWCTIGAGKYRGEPAIEVRLDGQRVGELTHLMSQRYAALVSQVEQRGGRPGCEAEIHHGDKGMQLVLRLPRDATGVLPAPPVPQFSPPGPVYSAAVKPPNVFAAHRPKWIAAGVVGLLFIIGIANSKDDSPSTSPAAQVGTSTTTTTTRPTTTRPTTTSATTTTTTTTTTVAPPPPPPAVPQPAPKPVAPPPAPEPLPAPPAPKCDPNYSGCVPIASDVDCQGGSGDGPAYVAGPVQVIGSDIYRLDNDKDGIGCE